MNFDLTKVLFNFKDFNLSCNVFLAFQTLTRTTISEYSTSDLVRNNDNDFMTNIWLMSIKHVSFPTPPKFYSQKCVIYGSS